MKTRAEAPKAENRIASQMNHQPENPEDARRVSSKVLSAHSASASAFLFTPPPSSESES